MKFRLLMIAGAATLLSGCGQPTISQAQQAQLCEAFWVTADSSTKVNAAQVALLDALDDQDSKDVIKVDTRGARKAAEQARDLNESSRHQLAAVCGADTHG